MMRLIVAVMISFGLGLSAHADTVADSSAVSATSTSDSINIGWLALKTFAILILIIGLIIGGVFLLKRLFSNQLPGAANQEWFQILARLPIQPKQSLALVKVFERIVLVGITESSITLLSEFSQNQDVKQILSEFNKSPQQFSKGKFWRLMKRHVQS